jgi:hypothetical protein
MQRAPKLKTVWGVRDCSSTTAESGAAYIYILLNITFRKEEEEKKKVFYFFFLLSCFFFFSFYYCKTRGRRNSSTPLSTTTVHHTSTSQWEPARALCRFAAAQRRTETHRGGSVSALSQNPLYTHTHTTQPIELVPIKQSHFTCQLNIRVNMSLTKLAGLICLSVVNSSPMYNLQENQTRNVICLKV